MHKGARCRMPTDDAADRAWLAQIAAGDQDALRTLYDEYYPRLWRYLWYELAGDAALTEEVIQDCFLAVWHSASTFRGSAKVVTWLFQIAHNHAANARRAQEHRLNVPFPAEVELESDVSVEDTVINRMMLTEALDHLIPIHQVVLDLFCYQGFTLAEIAAILRIPVGTVKSRLNHARRALLRHLAATQPQEERS